MAELLPVTTAAADSADFTISGTTTTLALNGTNRPFGTAMVQRKSSSGQYVTIGTLNDAQPAGVLAASGTYRVSKAGNTNAFGVDRD